ncbi:metallophosphoesterase family protein [Pelagibacterium xiamenense]|uniref:metallophosphoesterase family protein n=1 Tax=Pelagibacterium xiamenense TaxID=2901140 RepID=UPI001E378C64|nr:metallophosphoesterase family protein [Pelagibacterium xiamenense]MCD7060296.1 metallophosphatase family protein [Pelagibacterium xiamenense]
MRIAVIADIHGNALALEAVLADIAAQKADAICNLGDHFSGPLEPLKTAKMLEEIDALTIAGNHDRYLLEEPVEEMDAVDKHAMSELRARDLDWIRGQPGTAAFEDALYLCHGTPSSDDIHWLDTKDEDKTFVATPADVVAADAQGIDFPLICCGHSHVARQVELPDGRIVFNPGSVGRPAYTMSDPVSAARVSPAAGYALVTRNGTGWGIDLRQVSYDHKAAADLARKRGFKGWARDLAHGRKR